MFNRWIILHYALCTFICYQLSTLNIIYLSSPAKLTNKKTWTTYIIIQLHIIIPLHISLFSYGHAWHGQSTRRERPTGPSFGSKIKQEWCVLNDYLTTNAISHQRSKTKKEHNYIYTINNVVKPDCSADLWIVFCKMPSLQRKNKGISIYVCMYICVCIYLSISIYLCIYVCMHVSIYLSILNIADQLNPS